MRLCAKAQPANMSLIHRRTTSAFPFVLYRDTDTKVNNDRMAGYPSEVLTFLYEEIQSEYLEESLSGMLMIFHGSLAAFRGRKSTLRGGDGGNSAGRRPDCSPGASV